jgi:hypothetical protein
MGTGDEMTTCKKCSNDVYIFPNGEEAALCSNHIHQAFVDLGVFDNQSIFGFPTQAEATASLTIKDIQDAQKLIDQIPKQPTPFNCLWMSEKGLARLVKKYDIQQVNNLFGIGGYPTVINNSIPNNRILLSDGHAITGIVKLEDDDDP